MKETLNPGAKFAGYLVRSLLGQGGMADVYRAWDPSLERDIALKILNRNLATDESFQRRFVRESRVAASLTHPNVVPIFATGKARGLLYIAMQLVEGTDLQHLLERERRLDVARALSIIGQVARALDAAHRRSLIHRDVKPANILIVPRVNERDEDDVYLSDFGLTKRRDEKSRLTTTGQFLGTLDYVSPEQIQGGDIDGRADVYSLGCVLYECLTGEAPFNKSTEVALIYAHLQDHPPLCTEIRSDLPVGIDTVISTAMAKSPADRYSTAGELLSAARATLASDSRPIRLDVAEPANVVGPALSHQDRVFPIYKTRNTIGRFDALAAPPVVDVTDLDTSHEVSRGHAIVTVGPTITIQDLGSRNGTVVNGEPLDSGVERELQDGDEVVLARHLRLKYSTAVEWPSGVNPEWDVSSAATGPEPPLR